MTIQYRTAYALLVLGCLPFQHAAAVGPAVTTIIRDGSLGSGPLTPLTPSGTVTKLGIISPVITNDATYNKYTIPESYGQRVGSNVFQSFSTFNLSGVSPGPGLTGDAAVFTVGSLTNNMVVRVTGGSPSAIGGLLKLDLSGFGGAGNLFFINPAGVTFTANAAVDVPGSLHLSTANYLRFPTGNFYATTAGGSTLSAADPAAFGFLGTTRASIVNSGPNPVYSANSISLVGGDVTNSSNLNSQGNIRIAAVGQGAVEVPVSGAMPTLQGTYTQTGQLSSYAAPGSELTIGAGSINVTQTFINAHSATTNINAANDITFDGQGSAAIGGFSGVFVSPTAPNPAGDVNVTAGGNLSLLHGGSITQSTTSNLNSGTVNVKANNITLDGSKYDLTGIYSQSGGLGSASTGLGGTGAINVTATGNISIVHGAQISNSTNSKGSAGTVTVSAQNLTADGANSTQDNLLRDYVGITSAARPGSSGGANAGDVVVNVAGNLSLLNGARISTSTYSSGTAGNVSVNAGNLLVDGSFPATAANIAFWNTLSGKPRYDGNTSSIQAAARAGSSGQTGNVNISAANQITFSNGGEASIQNNATVATPSAIVPTTLSVTAPNITLKDASISAAATGNIAASNIRIRFTGKLGIDPSTISTSSNLGNGGAITIIGNDGIIFLDNSQITTSVTGLTGNGGNISIQANSMVMNTGFIQANTAAPLASGGIVFINVNNLITSGNSLFLGGNTPYTAQPFVFGFNVIQAASPTGISGDIKLTTPALDVARSLAGLNAKTVDTGGLGRNPCRVTGGSSMAQAGRGGFAPSATDLLAPDSALASGAGGGSTARSGSTLRVDISNWEGSLIGKCG